MSKQEYKENRTRVFNLMGIDPADRNYEWKNNTFDVKITT